MDPLKILQSSRCKVIVSTFDSMDHTDTADLLLVRDDSRAKDVNVIDAIMTARMDLLDTQ